MEYPDQILFSDDSLPNDEIDDLFGQLERLEPPPALIAHILSVISELPLPTESITLDALDGPDAWCDTDVPS